MIKKPIVEVREDSTAWDLMLGVVFADEEAVDVGTLGSAGSDVVKIAAVHEFGAEIQHPGGTAYGYKSKAAAGRDEIRFLKKGEGYLVLGETGPHTIVIPERSFIRSTVDEKEADYFAQIEADTGLVLDGKMTKEQMLKRLGVTAEGDVKQKIIDIKEPGNAASTLRAKAPKTNPLVVSGNMVRSQSHRVVTGAEA